MVRGSTEVVVIGTREAALPLVDAVYRAYLPDRVLGVVDPDDPRSVEAASLLAKDKPGKAGTAVAYVCRGRTCSAPVSDAEALVELLKEVIA